MFFSNTHNKLSPHDVSSPRQDQLPICFSRKVQSPDNFYHCQDSLSIYVLPEKVKSPYIQSPTIGSLYILFREDKFLYVQTPARSASVYYFR